MTAFFLFSASLLFVTLSAFLIYEALAEHRFSQLVRRQLAAFDYSERQLRRRNAARIEAARWVALRMTPKWVLNERINLVRRAGYFRSSAAYEFVAVQLMASLFFSVAAAAAALAYSSTLVITAACLIPGAAFGYWLPVVVMTRMAARRERVIDRELPLFTDTLVLLIRAGASLDQAFRQLKQIGREVIPAMHRTIELLVEDLDRGKSYEIALKSWSEKLNPRIGTDLAGLFLQSLTQGTALSTSLHEFAELEIDRRKAGAREVAGRRMIHLTVAMVVFLLPPLMILIAAPGVSALIAGFQTMGGK